MCPVNYSCSSNLFCIGLALNLQARSKAQTASPRVIAASQVTDEETNAFIGLFDMPNEDKVAGVSLREQTYKLYLLLMLVMTVCFLYIQTIRSEVFLHYTLIYDISQTKAQAMLRSKVLISLIATGFFTATFVYGKGITMVSFGLLFIIMNGLVHDFTARLATPSALMDTKMNIILCFRLSMIAILGRITYICIFRKTE